MSEKKTLKRSVKAVWDEIKGLRSERAKLYAPSDILASADTLTERANELRRLANQLSTLSAMPVADAKPSVAKSATKRERKRKAD